MTDEVTQFQNSNSDDLLQLVVFKLGTEEFGVDIMQVQEIIRMPDLTRIPKSPSYIKGVINLRGKIIVVMSLDNKFHMNSNELTDESRIIVVDIDGTVAGMVVDSVSEVIRMSGSNVDDAPEIISQKINAEYLKGVGKLDDRMLILLNMEHVLSETAS
jgi:purine-binding chemotaxis protein CheW